MEASESLQALLRDFGTAAERHDAAVLVGAGLSVDAGVPTWAELLRPVATELGVRLQADTDAHGAAPYVGDFPLVAEYFVDSASGSRERLEDLILDSIRGVGEPTRSHGLLAGLPVAEIWTTNYENLIELAAPDSHVIRTADDWQVAVPPGQRRIIKMHGSLNKAGTAWHQHPIITRSDYETYEYIHDVMTQRLRATFLTKPMLFLGFSFADPNIEVLLRLVRTGPSGRQHYAVLRRPSDPANVRLHDLKVNDLRKSAIEVVEIDDYGEIQMILRQLVRRTRPPRLFVAGSGAGPEEEHRALCRQMGAEIARIQLDRNSRVTVASFAGPAGMEVANGAADILRANDAYDPRRFEFYYRAKAGSTRDVTGHQDRTGTLIFTGDELSALRRSTIDQCRAMLVIGGGRRTAKEIEVAERLGIPIVPLATAGGAGRDHWHRLTGTNSLPLAQLATGAELASLDQDGHVATTSAGRLLVRSMNLREQ